LPFAMTTSPHRRRLCQRNSIRRSLYATRR